jgi:hypothetical protein
MKSAILMIIFLNLQNSPKILYTDSQVSPSLNIKMNLSILFLLPIGFIMSVTQAVSAHQHPNPSTQQLAAANPFQYSLHRPLEPIYYDLQVAQSEVKACDLNFQRLVQAIGISQDANTAARARGEDLITREEEMGQISEQLQNGLAECAAAKYKLEVLLAYAASVARRRQFDEVEEGRTTQIYGDEQRAEF